MPFETCAGPGVRDELTTLILPDVFLLALEQEISRANRHDHGLAVLLFELDHPGAVRAAHGEGCVDRLVERIGLIARRFFRAHDWVARHGPHSIVVLLPEASLDIGDVLAGRFIETIRQRLVLTDLETDVETRITMSAAVVGAETIRDGIDAADVMHELEGALARARLNGGSRTEQTALLPTSVTIASAAILLGRSTQEIVDLVREGRLHTSRRGKHFYIVREELETVRRT